ncbi:DsbA family protein [Leptospira ryugenii]|nr:thioredoxin domain-containing protein [Leptospira ryugenii]
MENSNQKWIEQPLSKIVTGLAVLFALVAAISLPSFVENFFLADAVMIGGKRYDINDVKKTSPVAFSKFQTEYQSLVKNTLSEFAQDKLFELVAKEKNIKPSEVLSQGFVATEPSNEEIQAVYTQYKPQFGGKSLAEVRDQIIKVLKNQQEQQHNQGVYKEIVTKYPVEFKLREIEQVRVSVETKGNPSTGKEGAKITIIEFSDFECPFCKRSQDVNRRLREKYKDDIQWVFRDFPLPFHENAMYAHMAANCSIPQNKYWDVFQVLFENSGNLSPGNVDYLVTKAGLNAEKYQACMKDKKKLQAEIDSDIEDGQKVGVNGTPAFFINGIFVSGALPFENFDEIIQKELNK